MGEYIKINGVSAKLGTCEQLYYVSYDELKAAIAAGVVTKDGETSFPVEGYIGTKYGWLYRWPFPDERAAAGGRFASAREINARDYDRKILIPLGDADIEFNHNNVCFDRTFEEGSKYRIVSPCPYDTKRIKEEGAHIVTVYGGRRKIAVVGEKLMPDGTLQTLFACPICGGLFRLGTKEVEEVRKAAMGQVIGYEAEEKRFRLAPAARRYLDELRSVVERVRGAEEEQEASAE